MKVFSLLLRVNIIGRDLIDYLMKILTEKEIVRDSKRKNYVMLLKILMKKNKKRNIIIIIIRKII